MTWQNRPIRILVVDDDEDDYILLKDYLMDIRMYQFTVDWAATVQEAEQIILKGVHDLYFFDYLLGASTGVDLLKKLSGRIDAPVIVLTGKGDRKADLEAMASGAADYIFKTDIDPEKLERSIRYTLERHAAIRALQESEEKYRSIFERSRDMIYITDYQGRFITVNDSATRIFGYSREEFANLKAADLYVNPEERLAYLEAINQTGVVSNYEVALRDKFNNIRYCIISGSIQLMGEESRVFYHGIIHDITRRKKIEKDLLIAEKLAVTGRIVRTLAHEVRNPLTNINLSVEQLEEELKDSPFQTFTEIIKRNCRRINDLISELLQTSRPMNVVPVRTSISSIIDDTIALAYDRILLKGVKVEKNIVYDKTDIAVDKSKLQIALLNIIINAIEAMPDQGGELSVSCTEDEGKCLISIKDNGTGIRTEDLGRLFEPYFTAKSNGMGLGLATTHNIIQSHRGTIDVETELGRGTNFVIALPV